MTDDFDFEHFLDDLKSGLDDDSPFVEVEPRQQAPEPPQEPRKAPARETAPRKRETPPAPEKQPKKKASPIKSIIYIVLIIVCLVVIVKSCGGGNEKATPAADPTQAPVAEEVTETAAPQTEQAVLSADACDSIVKTVIESTWEGGYEFERDDNSVIIKVWNDGVTAEAAAAMQGDESVLEEWNKAMDNMVYFTDQVQDAYNQNGHGDTLVAVFLLNDTNKDNVLAVTSLGMVMYDAINGIDLMGVEE